MEKSIFEKCVKGMVGYFFIFFLLNSQPLELQNKFIMLYFAIIVIIFVVYSIGTDTIYTVRFKKRT